MNIQAAQTALRQCVWVIGSGLDSGRSPDPRPWPGKPKQVVAQRLAKVRKALQHPTSACACSGTGDPCPDCNRGFLADLSQAI